MRARLVLAFGALVLVASACSPAADDAASTTAPAANDEPATTQAESPDTTAEVEATTTTQAAPATTQAPEPTAGCVVGLWLMDSQTMMDAVNAMVEGEFQGATFVHAGGDYTVEFGGDGSMVVIQDMWAFEVDTPDGKLTMTFDSLASGTYTDDGSTITSDLTTESFDFTGVVEADGQTFEIPTSPELPESNVEGGPYTCNGDTLVVVNDEGIDIVFARQ